MGKENYPTELSKAELERFYVMTRAYFPESSLAPRLEDVMSVATLRIVGGDEYKSSVHKSDCGVSYRVYVHAEGLGGSFDTELCSTASAEKYMAELSRLHGELDDLVADMEGR